MGLDVFEWLSDRICSECCAGNEDCGPCESACRFWGDMDKLRGMCEEAECFAEAVRQIARNYTGDEAWED